MEHAAPRCILHKITTEDPLLRYIRPGRYIYKSRVFNLFGVVRCVCVTVSAEGRKGQLLDAEE